MAQFYYLSLIVGLPSSNNRLTEFGRCRQYYPLVDKSQCFQDSTYIHPEPLPSLSTLNIAGRLRGRLIPESIDCRCSWNRHKGMWKGQWAFQKPCTSLCQDDVHILTSSCHTETLLPTTSRYLSFCVYAYD